MIVFTRGFPSVLPTVKEKGEAGVHLFKSDVKTPENISNYLSYSLGQDIRPSILIKAPIGQKYLEEEGQNIGLKRGHQNETKMTLSFPKVFHFFVVCFLLVSPLSNSIASDY